MRRVISRLNTCLVVLLATLPLYGCDAAAADATRSPALPENFILGGQLPFWVVAGEPGTPSASAAADAARPRLQARAAEMFDVIIPSSIHWNWVEPEQGMLDFHRYRWAADWASRYGKPVFVQHVFWAWDRTKPGWLLSLDDASFRAALFRHIADVRQQIGPVPRLSVINEMTCKSYMTERLGAGIIKTLFERVRRAFPGTELFLNEHACPDAEHPDKPGLIQETLDRYAALVLKLEADRVPFDRVGFQSYFSRGDVLAQGGTEAFIEKYNAAVNRFSARTGRKLIITELGFQSRDEDFRADFLRAFFRMTLSNPNIEGLFLFHWLEDQAPGTALVNRDGTLTRAGDVFYQVFHRAPEPAGAD